MSTATIRAYWPLIKSALVPVGVMKIILILVTVCFVLMFIIAWFFKGGIDNAAPVLLMSIFIYLFFMLILLPTQALATISSKSLRYLADFRKLYFVLAVILSMALPVAVIVFKLITAESAIGFRELIHFGLQVWLLSSAYVVGLFFTAYRFPLFQGAIFFTFAVLGQVLHQLAQWSFLQLIIALSVSWLVFGFWWLRLRPQKYFINAYALNMEQMMSGGTTANPSVNPTAIAVMNFFAPSSKPASFLGTRLMGMPDGNASIFRMGLLYLMMSLLLLGFFKWIFNDNFQNVMNRMGLGFVFYVALVGSYGFLTAICRNIKSSWLLFPGSRSELFQFIEKRCFGYSIKMMWITPILAILLNQFSGVGVIDLLSFIVVAISVVVVNAMTFYLTLSIYTRDNDSKIGGSGWQAINIFISVLVMLLICALFQMNYYLAMSATLFLIIVANFLMRRSLLKKWQKINFVRVG